MPKAFSSGTGVQDLRSQVKITPAVSGVGVEDVRKRLKVGDTSEAIYTRDDLQECYLQRRRHWTKQVQNQEERDNNPIKREGYHAGLKDFQSVLSIFTRYSRLRIIVELRPGDLFHSADIISSIEFDRDDEFFLLLPVFHVVPKFLC
ncbi:WD40 repeat-containing protein [Artemisia annua]|uniref:WD40 repeat-containing protein n=1 Tax=Artemisia annua TaxID=35608 RepID=A0A2U1PVX0_ARTAN|nr:WD40 repeat-containing protein [Artemisia annua]